MELFKNEIPLSIQDQNFKTQQYLSVIVPEELKDYAFIQVQIVKSNSPKINTNELNSFFKTFLHFKVIKVKNRAQKFSTQSFLFSLVAHTARQIRMLLQVKVGKSYWNENKTLFIVKRFIIK